MLFALMRVGGKQYRVETGAVIVVDRLAVEPGANVEGVEVLMLADGDNVQIGAPTVAGASIAATVVRHAQGKKIRVFKYKAKKNYRRRIGARAHQTLLRINSISA
jgi:large subunit ribosomal protein L21